MRLCDIRNRSYVGLTLMSYLMTAMSTSAFAAGPNVSRTHSARPSVSRADDNVTQPIIRDVALGENGVLRGKILDRQGKPVADSEVVLIQQNKEVARTVSSSDGDFHFTAGKGGVHQLATHGDMITCRLWAGPIAPPCAQPGVLLCDGKEVVRGQCSVCCSNTCRRSCSQCCPQPCQSCDTGEGFGSTSAPAVPSMSMEELRNLAPDVPAEQFAALTQADVIIVNPEHISIAISYDATTGAATVVGKGGDEVALQMQQVARNSGIPIVRNPALAQAMFTKLNVGDAVPADLLGQLQDIMAQVSASNQPTSQGGSDYSPEFESSGGGIGPGLLLAAAAAVAIPVAITAADDDDES